MDKKRFLIIGDSSLDMNDELRERLGVVIAPFTVTIGGREYVDDDELDMDEFLTALTQAKDTPRSAAPSPGAFLRLMEQAQEGVFIITLSSKLSGSYNAAMVAKGMAKEQYPGLKVQVVDSMVAVSGETTLAILLHEGIEAGLDFQQLTELVLERRDNDKLFFLLDNIETLVKNGRMSLMKGVFAMLLHIKPILTDDGEGNICLADKARTYERAFALLAKQVIALPFDTAQRVLVIAHCQAEARARKLKEMIAASRCFREIVIVPMRALSSTYANIGGLVVAC